MLLILNGPNLNRLGTRQPGIYGAETLADIAQKTEAHAKRRGAVVDFRQSNHEGVLVDWVQEATGKADGLIINAGAYTHTSIALLDALLGAQIPVVEVHLSNIHRREAFRHTSYVSQAALGMITGFGSQGYLLAVDALLDYLARSKD